MNKLRPLVFLVCSVLIAAYGCNKSTITAVAVTSSPFQANIDGNVWIPDTVSAAINYNATRGTKTFTCTGTRNAKQVTFSVTVNSASATPGFPLGTYLIDSVRVTAQYNTQQKDASGNYVFAPQGTVGNNGGSITITAVDSVNKQISGTFNFYSRSVVYDNQGNIVSVSVDNITGGEFGKLPYTFSTNNL